MSSSHKTHPPISVDLPVGFACNYKIFECNRNGAKSFLDPHHTHFILVDDESEKYGGEINFRSKFEQHVSS